MIKINEIRRIREQLHFTHLVIFGIDESGTHHVLTHGKTRNNAIQAARIGNDLKEKMNWPISSCNTAPLERICSNCDFWQRGYHRPGDVIQDNQVGKCIFRSDPVVRFEKDIGCGIFSPII